MRLPETWEKVRLANLVTDMQPGFAQRPGEDEGATPQIRTHNVTPAGQISLEGIKSVTPSSKELERYSLKKNDIIFNNTNSEEWVGKTALFDFDGDFVFSNHMTRIRVCESVDPRYLSLFLHFLWSVGFLRQKAKKWVSQAAVDQKTLSTVQIILPSLLEQQKIVEVLSHAEGLASQQLLAIQKAEALTELAFIKMFGDPEPRINKRWPAIKLGDCVPVETGGTPSREVIGNFDGGIAWVKTTELKDSVITETEESISEKALKSSNAKVHPVGTILLAMYGQGQTRGRTAKLAIPAACNQACAALLPCDDFDPDYLWAWLQLSYESVRGLGRGGQQANLNLSLVRGLKIPKPPIELQRLFSEQLQAINQYKSEMQLSTFKLQELRESLTMAAVTGELTESWREDNIELLRQEAAKKPAKHRKGRPFKAAFSVVEHVRPHRELKLHEPKRGWLIEQLSDFQNNVRWALYELKGTLVVDDPDALDRFCEQWPVKSDKHLHDRIRRALDQLAALGLIAKVSVRNEGDRFLTGYRPLRDEERECQSNDVARLEKMLAEVAE